MTMRRTVGILLAVALGIAALGLAAYAWLVLAPRRVPEGQPPMATLGASSLPGLRETFSAGDGEPRILAMLSPT